MRFNYQSQNSSQRMRNNNKSLTLTFLFILVIFSSPGRLAGAVPAEVIPSKQIFSDGYESGDLSAWSSFNGTVKATSAAARTGLFGGRVRILSRSPKFFSDLTPYEELSYRADFALDIHSLQISENASFRLFEAGTRNKAALVVLVKYSENQYWLQARARLDSGAWKNTPWTILLDKYADITIFWKRAGRPQIHDGKLLLLLNGVLAGRARRLDNDTRQIDRVRLGVTRRIAPNVSISGSFFLDNFSSQNPSPPPPVAVQFAVIGDYGKAAYHLPEVAALVNGWAPDFIITLGDNNYENGEAATIDENIGQFFHQYIGNYSGGYGSGALSNRFFPALGNHDWRAADAQPYLDYFTLPGNERYYDFVQGPLHFFVIDSDPNEPDGITKDSAQALWLKEKLQASTSAWKIVYLHHTIYTSGLRAPNQELRWPFKAWGADLVLTGHDHFYERMVINDFAYIINGLGGKSLNSFGPKIPGSLVRYNADYGAVLAQASETHLNFKFINSSGQIIDSFTFVRP